MNIRKVFSIKTLVLVLILHTLYSILNTNAFALKPESWEPPEKNGVYDVPGYKNLKVRVFVHNQKPDPTIPPQIIDCSVDNKSGDIVESAGWELPLIWDWYLNVNSAPSSIAGNLKAISDSSIGTWQSELTGRVQLEYKGQTTINKKAYDGKNVITWGRTSGTALGVTYTWYNP